MNRLNQLLMTMGITVVLGIGIGMAIPIQSYAKPSHNHTFNLIDKNIITQPVRGSISFSFSNGQFNIQYYNYDRRFYNGYRNPYINKRYYNSHRYYQPYSPVVSQRHYKKHHWSRNSGNGRYFNPRQMR